MHTGLICAEYYTTFGTLENRNVSRNFTNVLVSNEISTKVKFTLYRITATESAKVYGVRMQIRTNIACVRACVLRQIRENKHDKFGKINIENSGFNNGHEGVVIYTLSSEKKNYELFKEEL